MIWLIKFAMGAIMPRSEMLPGIADTQLDGFLRKLRAEAEPIFWIGLVAGAVIFTFTPVLTLGWPVPAFCLSQRALDKHADRILAHRFYVVRQGVYLVRLSAGMCWGADPAVRALFALPAYPPDPGTFRTS